MKMRPGSWNVLILTMTASFAVAKWVTQRCAPCVGPIMLLIFFITKRYKEEIDSVFRRIRKFFCVLAMKLWIFLTPKDEVNSGQAMA